MTSEVVISKETEAHTHAEVGSRTSGNLSVTALGRLNPDMVHGFKPISMGRTQNFMWEKLT